MLQEHAAHSGPFLLRLPIGSLTKGPRFFKSFILAQGKIHKTVFVHAKQCLPSSWLLVFSPLLVTQVILSIPSTRNRTADVFQKDPQSAVSIQDYLGGVQKRKVNPKALHCKSTVAIVAFTLLDPVL